MQLSQHRLHVSGRSPRPLPLACVLPFLQSLTLNPKLIKTLDQVYDKANDKVKLVTGAVRKIYKTDCKTTIKKMEDFQEVASHTRTHTAGNAEGRRVSLTTHQWSTRTDVDAVEVPLPLLRFPCPLIIVCIGCFVCVCVQGGQYLCCSGEKPAEPSKLPPPFNGAA